MTGRRAAAWFAVALAGCSRTYPPAAVYDAGWTDADRIGTFPDFYESVPKNVLMISVDTFRRDRVGFLSGSTVTPTLDVLAASGVTLANHTTCSNWTFAGVTCTLRGAYNVENEFIPRLSETSRQPVPPGAKFLAGWLGDAGYHTAVHSGNSWYAPLWGNTQGFDEVVQGPKDSALAIADAGLEHIEWYERTMGGPWFLHVHLMEPHSPYVPPDEYIRAEVDLDPVPWDLADKDQHYDALADWPDMTPEFQALLLKHLTIRYDGELKYWDDQLAQILIDANARGLLDDTLVVLWNDHGEQMFEHGYQTHAYTLYREENDGWAVFWAQNIVPERWDGPTVSIDLVPTLLQLEGIPIPPEVTGYPLGERPEDEPRYATSVARLGPVQSVRQGDWKMNFSWTSGTVRLYDLATDPQEMTDLADPADAQTQAMWALLEPWVQRTDPLVDEYGIVWPPGL